MKGRIMLAAAGSGSGKTMLGCCLLALLRRQGKSAGMLKCGPDYIDTMLAASLPGVATGNLDGYFLSPRQIREKTAAWQRENDFLLIEGAMGYYDGICFTTRGSCYELAAESGTPVVLVLDCKGMGASVLALLRGFLEQKRPSGIVGVICNRMPETLYQEAKDEIRALGAAPLGCVPEQPLLRWGSRHLGLQTPESREQAAAFFQKASEAAARTLDLDGIWRLAAEAEPAQGTAGEGGRDSAGSERNAVSAAAGGGVFAGRAAEAEPAQGTAWESGRDSAGSERNAAPAAAGEGMFAGRAAEAEPAQGAAWEDQEASAEPDRPPLRVAVARDEAFCFCYEDNLRAMRAAGLEPVFFSPLRDAALPGGVDGLYLCGGYPELYAAGLQENRSMRRAVAEAVRAGLPTIAECGGFLYLHQGICAEEPETAGQEAPAPPRGAGGSYAMAGVLPGLCRRGRRLQHFGYHRMQAVSDSMLFRAGEEIPVHEFHYYRSDEPGDAFLLRKEGRGGEHTGGYASTHFYGGFPHLYFDAAGTLTERFYGACLRWHCAGKTLPEPDVPEEAELQQEHAAEAPEHREAGAPEEAESQREHAAEAPARREAGAPEEAEPQREHAAEAPECRRAGAPEEAEPQQEYAPEAPEQQGEDAAGTTALPRPAAWHREAQQACERRWNAIGKPLHALGAFERACIQMAGMTGNPDVPLAKKGILVFCADNGIVEEHVSQSDSSVTEAVARSLAEGHSNVNLLCRLSDTEVFPIDIGMRRPLPHPGIDQRAVRRGTANFLKEPVMTRGQTLQALEIGKALVREKKAQGFGALGTGEMGIGNTTTAAAVLSVLLGLDPDETAGRGAGLSEEGLRRKREVIRQGIARHRLWGETDVLRVLSCVGGLDLAGLTGVFLGGALYGMPIVLDGVITAAAALCAERLCPGARRYMLASHLGREPACGAALKALSLTPVLTADLALGEGSGAALFFACLTSVSAVYESSHTFEALHIAPYAELS